MLFVLVREAITRVEESLKKVFLEISKNSLENICAGVSFLIKLKNCTKCTGKMYILFFCELSERFQNTYSVETCEHMSASIYLLKVIETPDQ